jgi:hypothetical protein
VAVTVWEPAERVEVLKETTPLPFSGAWASTALSIWKVTWPVGTPEPGGAAATVAVNVTDWPGAAGFADEVSVVVDPLLWTNWTSDELPPLKLASPLYVAVTKCLFAESAELAKLA